MGFTRRYEQPWIELYNLLKSGVIGDLKMMLIRSVIPYTHYFMTWHRTRALSGGALNDKASHYTDVFNWFAGGHCLQVNAFGGRNLFEVREDAPEFCAVCDDWTLVLIERSWSKREHRIRLEARLTRPSPRKPIPCAEKTTAYINPAQTSSTTHPSTSSTTTESSPPSSTPFTVPKPKTKKPLNSSAQKAE